MKRFSSNITDEEIYCLFRETAKNYDPKLNDLEKTCVWESIANGLLTDVYDIDARRKSKWKKICIALLLVWLLTGGLAILRIIQLQELPEVSAPLPAAEPVTVQTLINRFITIIPAPEQTELQGSMSCTKKRAGDIREPAPLKAPYCSHCVIFESP